MAQLTRECVLGHTASLTDPSEFTATPKKSQLRANRCSFQNFADISRDVEAAAPLLPEAAAPEAPAEVSNGEVDAFSKRVRIGINASWVVNILLLGSKIGGFVLSGSYAVLASAVDSLVDILSQAVLAIAEYQARTFDRRFPIGRTRITELSVLACACIMFMSSALVVRESVGAVWDGFHGSLPDLKVDAILFSVLGVATVLKLALYIYCRVLRKNPIMVALSEDHLNDVMSNVAAIVGAAIAGNMPRYWFVDPAVALVFTLLIIRNWVAICWEQGQKMIGLEAPDELIEEVTAVTADHHPDMQLDRVTAYHHGSHMVVEVEVLLPASMTVRDSHDIALELQHKIEAIDSVERAFVHVDYERRPLEEHKVERNLKMGERDVMKPLAGLLHNHLAASASRPGSLGGVPSSSNSLTAAGQLLQGPERTASGGIGRNSSGSLTSSLLGGPANGQLSRSSSTAAAVAAVVGDGSGRENGGGSSGGAETRGC